MKMFWVFLGWVVLFGTGWGEESLVSFETEDCYISFVEREGERFVVKQIKDARPDEQFLLILDALGCHIAEEANIPVNRVRIIPANAPFPGKKVLELPATLHTFAKGVSSDEASSYRDLDLHQRYLKENTPLWHRWGPLAPEDTGLTKRIIHNMAKHPDLPSLVALDTFVGNSDRSPPNLFYDSLSDHFCGIDMAASFRAPLAEAACRQLKGMRKEQFDQVTLSALQNYASTLEVLLKTWPPEEQERMLLLYSERAGFKKGSHLSDRDVKNRIAFHIACIRDNYLWSVELVKVLSIFLKDFN